MTTDRAATDLIVRQTSEQATLKSGLQAEIEAVGIYSVEIADWTQDMSGQLNERMKDVEEFINNELIVDIPTGRLTGSLAFL